MPGDQDRSMSGIGEIEIEFLAGRLMRKQEGAAAEQQHSATGSWHQLSRVPVHLRDMNANDYTPGFVAIGPLHNREDRRLRPAERLKVAYLNNLILRGHPDPAHHLAVIQDYIRVVSAREQEARAMYAGEEVADIATEDFIQMMVLDGCFVIEHLVNVATFTEEPSMYATPFGPAQLSVDLVLAENQMPFFVLVDLLASTKLPEFQVTGYPSPVLLVKLVLYYLAGEKGRDISGVLPAADRVSHILHLFHMMITAARTQWEPPAVIETARTRWVPPAVIATAQEAARLLRLLRLLLFVPLHLILPEDKRRSASYGREGVPSASDLKRVGVWFKKAHGVSGSRVTGVASVLGPVPLSVKLRRHGNRLHLPQLRIEFRTAPVLLNLMAFEQSASRRTEPEVSAYVCFMAKMVQSAEDAGVLMAAEVVDTSGYGIKEAVARFFRAMGAASEAAAGDELLETSYLGHMLVALRERSVHQLYVMRANVQRNYITLLAELLTLITFASTIIQTYAALARH